MPNLRFLRKEDQVFESWKRLPSRTNETLLHNLLLSWYVTQNQRTHNILAKRWPRLDLNLRSMYPSVSQNQEMFPPLSLSLFHSISLFPLKSVLGLGHTHIRNDRSVGLHKTTTPANDANNFPKATCSQTAHSPRLRRSSVVRPLGRGPAKSLPPGRRASADVFVDLYSGF